MTGRTLSPGAGLMLAVNAWSLGRTPLAADTEAAARVRTELRDLDGRTLPPALETLAAAARRALAGEMVEEELRAALLAFARSGTGWRPAAGPGALAATYTALAAEAREAWP